MQSPAHVSRIVSCLSQQSRPRLVTAPCPVAAQHNDLSGGAVASESRRPSFSLAETQRHGTTLTTSVVLRGASDGML
ncbi:hypothetical protein CGCF415_v000382 [Colletotrichum fructicola]|uniref:Uncharacterized protein n=1 Tax=Colletotrichum fructicola (strain Nara gc5) TaxID=1213859 RepID=A0A7J6JKA8_COLFN|nr:uncharacterized protein CGCS363_v005070 [Colletotrichum siamense]KAF4489714.1 hypothetical protein CGGC5_v003560 [Colletotrichum fructicola Nara gc5]KAF4905866.1 hypothetical protein CGCFRS4_v000088 [Colletotrichum fructicola]KAF4824433.1 hypothetical protein CGCSCA5_v001231 [Colletotrichum siamense]KAF4917372.1 hypothetical protein CGCF415_v000382 [Colletotrichum fructicola]KAF4942303.1 hypothetical protein CGCF245_v000711 [Colletotrichum fructicola]